MRGQPFKQEKDSRILGMPLIDSMKEKVEKITGLARSRGSV
jgi:hypothetical protein